MLGEAPRLVFGNDAGLRNNIKPSLRVPQLLEQRGRFNFDLSRQDVAQIRNDGYLAVEDLYDLGAVDDLVQHFQRVIEDKDLTRPNGKYSVEVSDPLGSLPELVGLFNSRVRDLLHAFYGSSFRLVETQCFRNFPVPEEDRLLEAYSDFWHSDDYPVSWLKLYVRLSDWDYSDGPTEILSIPKTKKIMRSGYVNRYVSLFGKQGLAQRTADAHKLVGPRGSAFFFNPQRCLHRAGIPDEGHQRDAVMFFLSGSPAATDII